jgi:hypothetical protein
LAPANRASYAAEKRQALDIWAEHVLTLAEGREANHLREIMGKLKLAVNEEKSRSAAAGLRV